MATRQASPARNTLDGAKAPDAAPANTLLSSLPAKELAAVMGQGEQMSCTLREVFFENGDPIDQVYFPLTGMTSLVTVLNDGTSLEALTVGREGFVGLPLFHGIKTNRQKGICQIEGDFYALPAAAFVELIDRAPHLRAKLHRYSQFTNEVLAQSAACNSMHLVEQRCARWLLTTSDAIGNKSFALTQEFLSQMLAVRRPGVTVAIGGFERRSLVAHRYGKVTILDPEGLKKTACECYKSISDKARELLS